MLLLIPPADADAMCRMLGVEPDDEYALSALGEIGNIVGTSYINALAAMTGMEIEPTPPATATDMLGAIVATRAGRPRRSRTTSRCCSTRTSWSRARTARSPSCSSPTTGGVDELLSRLGLS